MKPESLSGHSNSNYRTQDRKSGKINENRSDNDFWMIFSRFRAHADDEVESEIENYDIFQC